MDEFEVDKNGQPPNPFNITNILEIFENEPLQIDQFQEEEKRLLKSLNKTSGLKIYGKKEPLQMDQCEVEENNDQPTNAFSIQNILEIFESEPLQIDEEEEINLINSQSSKNLLEIFERDPFDIDFDECDDLVHRTQFQNAQKSMNEMQKRIFDYITKKAVAQINGGKSRLRLFITGNAGTGKTFLFNMLCTQINMLYGENVTEICAPTGVAARLVRGSTLHSALKLPISNSSILRADGDLSNGDTQWKYITYMFIDEISMVSHHMLCSINKRLKLLKKSPEPFGGINVLVFGDLLQLPPVNANPVFRQPKKLAKTEHLWRLFSLIELKENMRQQGNTPFIDVLNSLRIGELRDEHLATLSSKVSTDFTGEFGIEKAIRIYPTNCQVEKHNQAVIQHFLLKGVQTIKIKAQDKWEKPKENTENITIKRVIPSDAKLCLPDELELFVGAKVMLRFNKDVSTGLVNGAIGFIVDIIRPLKEEDLPSVRISFDNVGVCEIQPESVRILAKHKHGVIIRKQLPIVLSWAATVHKMQGSTVDRAVVNLGSKLFVPGQAYVALSRVKSFDGLKIEELDPIKLKGRKICNRVALAEMSRMRRYHPVKL